MKAAGMPVSGLVVTFNSPVADHADAVAAFGAIPEVEIGESGGSKLAIVIDSADKDRDQEIWNTVRQSPGVIDVAIAMIAFDEENVE